MVSNHFEHQSQRNRVSILLTFSCVSRDSAQTYWNQAQKRHTVSGSLLVELLTRRCGAAAERSSTHTWGTILDLSSVSLDRQTFPSFGDAEMVFLGSRAKGYLPQKVSPGALSGGSSL